MSYDLSLAHLKWKSDIITAWQETYESK